MKIKLFLIASFLLFFKLGFSQLLITEVYFNTPFNEKLQFNKKINGVKIDEYIDAYKHHRGEFIEIYNYSDKDINLGNWFIKDYQSAYWFPPGLIIKSGQFMVVAYSTIHTQPPYLTEFPALFPTTVGKESQIWLQDQIILRNKHENLTLGYSFNGFSTVDKSEVRWDYQAEPLSNFFPNVWSTPNEFYNIKSIQYHPDPQSTIGQSSPDGDTYPNYKATPNPLEATFKPPIQSYESIVLNDYINNYAYLDWSDNVFFLINQVCNLKIEKVFQNPDQSDLSDEIKCFNYDASGNITSNYNCSDEIIPPGESYGYNTDELEAIKKNITIYPNPVTSVGNYNVTLAWSGAALNNVQNVQVFSSTGLLVYTFTPTNGINTTTFSLQNQLPGAFIANFILNTGQVVSKNILKW